MCVCVWVCVPFMLFQNRSPVFDTSFFSDACTQFQIFGPFFPKSFFPKIQELHTQNEQNASHLLKNEALHSKYHKHTSKAKICKHLSIILIPDRFVCYRNNCEFCTVFYEIENRVKCWEIVSGFADVVCFCCLSDSFQKLWWGNKTVIGQ